MANEVNEVKSKVEDFKNVVEGTKTTVISRINLAKEELDKIYNDMIDDLTKADTDGKVNVVGTIPAKEASADEKVAFIKRESALHDIREKGSSTNKDDMAKIESAKESQRKDLENVKELSGQLLEDQRKMINENAKLIAELSEQQKSKIEELLKITEERVALEKEIESDELRKEKLQEDLDNAKETLEELTTSDPPASPSEIFDQNKIVNDLSVDFQNLDDSLKIKSSDLDKYNKDFEEINDLEYIKNPELLSSLKEENDKLKEGYTKSCEEIQNSFKELGMDVNYKQIDAVDEEPVVEQVKENNEQTPEEAVAETNGNNRRQRENAGQSQPQAVQKPEQKEGSKLPVPLSSIERAKVILQNYMDMTPTERVKALRTDGYAQLMGAMEEIKGKDTLNGKERNTLKNIIKSDKDFIEDDLSEFQITDFNKICAAMGFGKIKESDFNNMYGSKENILKNYKRLSTNNLKLLQDITEGYYDLKSKENLTDSQKEVLSIYEDFIGNPLKHNIVSDTSFGLRHPLLHKYNPFNYTARKRETQREVLNHVIASGENRLKESTSKTDLRTELNGMVNSNESQAKRMGINDRVKEGYKGYER